MSVCYLQHNALFTILLYCDFNIKFMIITIILLQALPIRNIFLYSEYIITVEVFSSITSNLSLSSDVIYNGYRCTALASKFS
jgi:hypothetical protein